MQQARTSWAPTASWALPVPPRGLGAHSVSETVGTVASEPRPDQCLQNLPMDKDCFLLALEPQSQAFAEILYTPNFQGHVQGQ